MSQRPPTTPGGPVRDLVARHRDLAAAARAVLDRVDGATVQVAELVERDRETRVRAELAVVGVEQLAAMTDRNLRLRALAEAGYRTAADLLGVGADVLDAVPGVGTQTARSVVAAVDQLAEAVRSTVPVRLELDRSGRPDSHGTVELLRLLHRLLRLRPVVEPHRTALTDYVSAVAVHAASAAPATHRLRWALTRRAARGRADRAVAALEGWDRTLDATDLPTVVARLTVACAEPDPDALALWDVLERRSAELYTVLGSIVPLAAETLAARGMLTVELAERVAAHPLDLSLMRVALRGYQEFGARFALNQGRALLGDEMGLGKTVQALAAMADLAARGQTHFLVVCPAGVLVTWLRETAARTALPVHRLHGPDRETAVARWAAEGGVGVTTFEGLAHVPLDVLRDRDAPEQDAHRSGDGVAGASSPGTAATTAASTVASTVTTSGLAMLVVDEAHAVKNPHARRSKTVAAWAARTWRVLLMTGTPLDNRLEDVVALVRLLDADLADALPAHLGLVGADTFRRTIAPVYLRRNRADVLVELPDLIAVDDWIDLSPAGEVAYRRAVATGNLMAMRRAAWLTPDPADSTKLARLVEIVEDAGANGHRTVVFSYFRDVLDTVAAALLRRGPGVGPVIGPLTGGVPADVRQAMIDAFTAAPSDAVLVAQITAGGVGLNLQAASVAVLCEPQLTPAAEAQAVARLHRMGQVRTVVAHRLLAEDGVDERVVELLAGKQRVFDAYVRESSLAASAVAAVDVTEAGLAHEVVAAEQARLGYGPVWDELGAEARHRAADEADDEAGRAARDAGSR